MDRETVNGKSVLFTYTSLSSFVKGDFDLLSSTQRVTGYHFAPVRGLSKNAVEMIRQFFYLLVSGWKYDFFYCWFADYHSLLPVLFARLYRKKAIVVIGGYDACRIRKLNYGAFCSPFRGWFAAKSMRMAWLILPVSEHVARKAKAIAPRAPQRMIYNCITLSGQTEASFQKSDTVLTVGLIHSERTFYLKGIDTFIEVARQLPGIRFEIVGIDQAKLAHKLGNLPLNVSLFNRVVIDELKSFYQNAKIYCQLSRSESFGVSIAEAMSFGNFPIVTNEGGMPEVVGQFGAVVDRNPATIATLIRERLLKDGYPDEAAIKQQVNRLFSSEQRAGSLLKLFQ